MKKKESPLDQSISEGDVEFKSIPLDSFFKRFGEIIMSSREEIAFNDPSGQNLMKIIQSCKKYAWVMCQGKRIE